MPVSYDYRDEIEKGLILHIKVIETEIDIDDDHKEIGIPSVLIISMYNNRDFCIFTDRFYYDDINYEDQLFEVTG